MKVRLFTVEYLFVALCLTSSMAVEPEPYVYLSQRTYKVTKYIGDVTVGATVTTIPITVEQENKINSSLPHFGLTGFFSDNFAIGRRSGVLTVAKPLETKSYSLSVQCLFDITFANGTKFQNSTSATVSVVYNEGVSFNQSLYTLVVDADVAERTVLFDLAGEEQVNTSIISVSSKLYSRASHPGFGVRPDGKVYTLDSLEPQQLYAFSVYLDFKGMDYKGNAIDGTVIANIHFNTLGCRVEDGGSHIWPVIHPCGVATANCSDFDDTLDNYGLVRRQCTREGKWLNPDFSQCRLKENAEPFVIVWMTYRTSVSRESNRALSISALQTLLTGYPVTSIDIHHSKRSMVTYGLAESYKVTLNSTAAVSETLLSTVWQTINGSRSFGFRSISTVNSSFGVLGFKPADRCMSFNRTVTILQYNPVCRMGSGMACSCQMEAPFQPDMCCTAEGRPDNTNNMCATVPPPVSSVTCTLSHSSTVRSLKMLPTARTITILWEFSAIPDTIIVTFTSKEHQGQLQFGGGELESTGVISGLLPSTIYTVSVLGKCAEDASIPPAIETDLIQTNEDTHPVAPFELRFNGVSDCDNLKTRLAWGAVQDALVSLLSHGCLCQFNTDRISGLSIDCLSESSAVLRGWIYGEGADPATKYISLLQTSADSKAEFTFGQQKVTLDPTCPVALATPSSPSCDTLNSETSSQPGVVLPNTSDNGTSVAGTVVGVVVGIIACVLLALILIVLILKYKGGSKSASPITSVSFSEGIAKQKPTDDEDKLHNDF